MSSVTHNRDIDFMSVEDTLFDHDASIHSSCEVDSTDQLDSCFGTSRADTTATSTWFDKNRILEMSSNFFDESSLFSVPIISIKPDIGCLLNTCPVEDCFHGDLVHAKGSTGEPRTNYRDTVELSYALDPTTLPYPTVEEREDDIKGLTGLFEK